MKPKEKANDLIVKYQINSTLLYSQAKQCALIAVEELIKETSFEVPNIRQRYWQEVKQEINNL